MPNSDSEIIIELLGNSTSPDEHAEIDDFINYIEDHGLSIPNNIYKKLLTSLASKYNVIYTATTNNWFFMHLSNLPPGTKAIRIRKAQSFSDSDYNNDL